MSGSARSKITDTLVSKLKGISKANGYNSDLFENVGKSQKFLDEIPDYPYICVSPTVEQRDYLPAGFKWGWLQLLIRIHVQNEDDPLTELENLLDDVEKIIDDNIYMVYDTTNNRQVQDMRLINITTDQGLLAPYAVADATVIAQYNLEM